MTRRAAEWIEQFRLDWMDGRPLHLMALARNLTKRQVVKIAQRMGLPRRPRARKIDDGLLQLLQRERSQGQSLRRIAQRYHISHTRILQVLRPRIPLRRCMICHGKEDPRTPHQHDGANQ